MIDHTGVSVTDAAKSRRFYEAALAPLGYQLMLAEQSDGGTIVGFGVPPTADFWLHEGPAQHPPVHIAFRAETRAQVDAFYSAALAAGGTDNGSPGLRPHYQEGYYGAFVRDPDGHNIEACCHAPG